MPLAVLFTAAPPRLLVLLDHHHLHSTASPMKKRCSLVVTLIDDLAHHEIKHRESP